MATDMRITSPVDVRADSRERVAYDLMNKIGFEENSNDATKRDYWLELYYRCYRATQGYDLATIKK